MATDPRIEQALNKLQSDLFDMLSQFIAPPDWANSQEFARSLIPLFQRQLGDGWEVYGAHIKDGNITFGVRPVLVEVILTISKEG